MGFQYVQATSLGGVKELVFRIICVLRLRYVFWGRMGLHVFCVFIFRLSLLPSHVNFPVFPSLLILSGSRFRLVAFPYLFRGCFLVRARLLEQS